MALEGLQVWNARFVPAIRVFEFGRYAKARPNHSMRNITYITPSHTIPATGCDSVDDYLPYEHSKTVGTPQRRHHFLLAACRRQTVVCFQTSPMQGFPRPIPSSKANSTLNEQSNMMRFGGVSGLVFNLYTSASSAVCIKSLHTVVPLKQLASDNKVIMLKTRGLEYDCGL